MKTSTNETNRTMKHLAKFFVATIAVFAVPAGIVGAFGTPVSVGLAIFAFNG